jgi:hypothetical protein
MSKTSPSSANMSSPPAKIDDQSSQIDLLAKFADNGLVEATGTNDLDLQLGRVRQLLETLWLPRGCSDEDRDARVSTAIADLRAIRPRDTFEGALAVQMIATHNAALGCLQQALETPQTPFSFERLKQAEKLMGLYLRQLEALNKHRGIGAPTFNVGNVNVQAGGQAIVGHVQAERRPDQREAEMPSASATHPPSNSTDPRPVETVNLRPIDPIQSDARIGRRGRP